MNKKRQSTKEQERERATELLELAAASLRASFETKNATDAAKAAKEGSASLMMRLARETGTQAAMTAITEAVEARYRAGELLGVPVVLGKPNKAGERSPVIPAGYRSHKSIVLSGLGLGFAFGDGATFGECRKFVAANQAAQKAGLRSPAEILRDSIVEQLETIVASMKDGSIRAADFPRWKVWLDEAPSFEAHAEATNAAKAAADARRAEAMAEAA